MSRMKQVLTGLGIAALALVLVSSLWLALHPSSATPTTSSDTALQGSSLTDNPSASASEASASTAASSSSQTIRAVNKPQSSSAHAAPNTQFIDELGNAVTLASKQGKPTVVNLWASWCPPCREEMPYFLEAYREYGDRVNFVMINATGSRPTETAETAQAYLQEAGLTDLPIYYDPQRQNQLAFKAVALPTTIFLDAQGHIVKQGAGGLTREDLFQQLAELTQ